MSVSREDWEKYNTGVSQYPVLINSGVHKSQADSSYTTFFFKNYGLYDLVSTQSKKILQFGASNGSDLKEFKDQGYDVMGYDYSEAAIKAMQKKEIPCKHIDLSAVDGRSLSYASALDSDLTQPLNIFAIRVFQYLDPAALQLLLFNLIDKMPAGSRLFIVNTIREDSEKTVERRNYITSFFWRSD